MADTNINLMDWDIITEDDFEDMQFDSGVIVKNFDPSSFKKPSEGDLEFVTSGDISVNYNMTRTNLGDDINNIFFQYLELQVITGVETANITVTALGFGVNSLKRALGAADVEDNKVTTRLYLKSEDFENVAWVGHKIGGGYVAVVMPKSLSTGGLGITATKGGKGRMSLTLTGFRSIKDKTKPEMEFYSTSASDGA